MTHHPDNSRLAFAFKAGCFLRVACAPLYFRGVENEPASSCPFQGMPSPVRRLLVKTCWSIQRKG